MLPARALPRVAVAVVLVGGLAACNREARADGGRFCEALRVEQISLSGGVTTQAQADALVARYRELEDLAPAAVRDEWRRLTDLLEAAAVAPPNDADAAQAITDAAVAAQQDVDVVTEWVRTTCGVDLRPGLVTDLPDPPAITPAPAPGG